MTKSGFNLERGNKEKNEHIPIEKLKKITNYESQEIFEETKHYELKKTTNDIDVIREDYRRVIKKFNTIAKRYTKIKSIVDETMYKAEQVQFENYNLKQENQNLRHEVLRLKDYINKTFEYVSLLFDFSKDRLKRLVNSFINDIRFKDK